MSIGRNRGKNHERAIAKRLNGDRIGCTGLATPDVVNDRFSVECKSRQLFPSWLTHAMKQAVTNAPEGKTPIVILHQTGQRHDSDLVIMRLQDFEQLMNSPETVTPPYGDSEG